jgi:hypothetical protein
MIAGEEEHHSLMDDINNTLRQQREAKERRDSERKTAGEKATGGRFGNLSWLWGDFKEREDKRP